MVLSSTKAKVCTTDKGPWYVSAVRKLPVKWVQLIWSHVRSRDLTFNSTRHIRNGSFPQGLPRTCSTFNSTRHIRNQGCHLVSSQSNTLSTPHGTLGTGIRCLRISRWTPPFNSTRHIRNGRRRRHPGRIHVHLSTPPGTLGTWISPRNPCSCQAFQLHTAH